MDSGGDGDGGLPPAAVQAFGARPPEIRAALADRRRRLALAPQALTGSRFGVLAETWKGKMPMRRGQSLGR